MTFGGKIITQFCGFFLAEYNKKVTQPGVHLRLNQALPKFLHLFLKVLTIKFCIDDVFDRSRKRAVYILISKDTKIVYIT